MGNFYVQHLISLFLRLFVVLFIVNHQVHALDVGVIGGIGSIGVIASRPIIAPTSASMSAGTQRTFSVSNGTAPFVFSASSGSVTSSGARSAIYKAANVAGSATVSVRDARGRISTALVTIVAAPVVDTIAPVVSITQKPAASTTSTVNQFVFSASDTGGSGLKQIMCSLDNAAFSVCVSPISVSTAIGNHTFSVRAADNANNLSTIVSYSFVVTAVSSVDTIAPVVAFVQVPALSSSNTVSQFTMSVTDAGGSGVKQILCSLDNAVFSVCTSPVAVMSPVGNHIFMVKASDNANNMSALISYSFTVTAAPSTGYLPYVNLALAAPAEVGSGKLIIRSTTELPSPGDEGGGQFRITCGFSHMANNDPIVFPGKTGASHHHTFFGNTAANAYSTPESLVSSGNSTCAGGIMNRSSYWVPSIIDTSNGAPIRPKRILVYYKTGNPAKVVAPPKGLRMIANGSANTVGPSGPNDRKNRFTCNEVYASHQENFPSCSQGGQVEWLMSFPECWDGKNLDSADHKSHMAYKVGGSCPSTHPVMIPEISFNVYYPVASASGTSTWRFSSDNYPSTLPGGFSGHGDWMNGWDETLMGVFVKSCLQAGKDCHGHLLGDGRMYDFEY